MQPTSILSVLLLVFQIVLFSLFGMLGLLLRGKSLEEEKSEDLQSAMRILMRKMTTASQMINARIANSSLCKIMIGKII